jgi:hypothetical protein
MSKWGRGLLAPKSPPGALITRVIMSACKEVKEDVSLQALDISQQHVNVPSKETTTVSYPEGRALLAH